jgi:pimeloyl-ACP methyl ester carboxylesterase
MLASDGYVTTDTGVRLWFQTVGSGSQVVVVPNGIVLLDDFRVLADRRTLVFYDVRNRGLSDTVTDPAKLARGIHNDVDDLDTVRRHFGLDRLNLIGHSYMGLMAVLYAMKYPAHVDRIVQIAPMPPDPRKEYPPVADNVLRETFAKLTELQKDRASYDPIEFCRNFWSILRVIYVTDPKDADKIRWDRCDLPNERNFMPYWMGTILPSIQALALTADDLAAVTAPVLTIHGTMDRSASHAGGQEWATTLPNARLLSVENAGHAPWIGDREVFTSITTFLDGTWPASAEEIAPRTER